MDMLVDKKPLTSSQRSRLSRKLIKPSPVDGFRLMPACVYIAACPRCGGSLQVDTNREVSCVNCGHPCWQPVSVEVRSA